MNHLRPLFASALLAIAVLGAAVAPAVHWAGHGLDAHESRAEVADGMPHVSDSDDGHAGECPDCARIQQVLGSEPATLPFYAGVVGLERAVPTPEDPASLNDDIATPEERGPPATA